VITAEIRLASAGLHVVDRWVDALADALADALPDAVVGGSLTGGRIEVTLPGSDRVAATAALEQAIAAAATPGVRVLAVRVS
jgi:hypothetical protein